MGYHSILFNSAKTQKNIQTPELFVDLNIDQIIRKILSGKEEYNLDEFYYRSLQDISEVNYRLEIMKDMESADLFNDIVDFCGKMKKFREYLDFSKKAHNIYQSQKWFLDAASLYCKNITSLHCSLLTKEIHSSGLLSFNNWLSSYINSDHFKRLCFETDDLNNVFESIKYCLKVERGKVTVDCDVYQEDYCESLNKTFENINDAEYDFPISFFTDFEMRVLETKVLEILRNDNNMAFNKLEEYCKNNMDFPDRTICDFDREIQFYVSYLDYIRKLKNKGYKFTYPVMSSEKRITVEGGYDLALACKNLDSENVVVQNNFNLENSKCIYIITGPNQGGKTTFARAIGQILYLASIGCPVPCIKAELFLFDRIFTHFSKEESLCNNAGRLKEELVRLKPIMTEVTENSIVIINELFASTTSYDAYTMGKKVLEHFIIKDSICLYVTHIYELAGISSKTVSLVAAVHSENDGIRTYKITKKPADGCAYANSIVEKYNLTYSKIKERIRI
jgi:Mismatch repair ATPase (MutS family)